MALYTNKGVYLAQSGKHAVGLSTHWEYQDLFQI